MLMDSIACYIDGSYVVKYGKFDLENGKLLELAYYADS